MSDPINVAISVSWRVECLNVLLDILKNNFKNDYRTIVYCNLAETETEVLKKIDMSLVDDFIHVPDPGCSFEAQKQMGPHKKTYAKRIQPAVLWSTIMDSLEKKNLEKFIYTECDFYPLDEDVYVSHFKKINSDNFACKF